jgi:hypothetical protein
MMPLTNATILLAVDPLRQPVVTAGRVGPEDWRLTLEALESGHGVQVALRGPIRALDQVLVAMALELERAEREA